MQVRKTYKAVNPELLYAEIRDFVLKQGVAVDEAKMETYTLPGDTSSFISRGTLTFRVQDKSGGRGQECLRAHVVGSTRTETKVILDIDEKLFPQGKVDALQADLDFIFSPDEED
jgi:hypothetical protein